MSISFCVILVDTYETAQFILYIVGRYNIVNTSRYDGLKGAHDHLINYSARVLSDSPHSFCEGVINQVAVSVVSVASSACLPSVSGLLMVMCLACYIALSHLS
jgi:hypothetical protein